MVLKNIQLTNFRNYKNIKLNFPPNVLILVGPNAAGKTNLLEAIRFLSFGKSFRVRSDKEVVRWGEDFVKIKGVIDNKNDRTDLEIVIERKDSNYYKTLKIDGIPKRTIDIIGNLTTVLFCPDDLSLVDSSPSYRRRFLNLVISQIDRSYCRDLIRFKNVLLNRNYLLSNIKHGRAQISELDFWDEKLIEAGSNLIIRRIEFIIFVNEIISKIYQQITGQKHSFMLDYECGIYLPKDIYADEIPKKYLEQIKQKRDVEIKKGATVLGPHRDNFLFILNNRNLSLFGSRGEYRSCVLALKIAELEFLKKIQNRTPILLMDDIFSEFDEERRNLISNIVSGQQTIITTADVNSLPKSFKETNIFEIENGRTIGY